MGFTYKNYEESDAVKKYRQQLEDNSTYKESDTVKQAREAMNAHDANKVADWTGGTYGEAIKNAMDRITNREKFTYDLNADMLYQQYKDQYIAGGKLAMMYTMGQAAALTGGYGNSYASAVGNQAYQGYLQKLNDVVPQLYQLARDAYDREGQDMYNQMNMYNQAYQTEYGEHRDAVNDWNTEANRLQDRYYNESNQDYSRFSDDRNYYSNLYNNERSYDYGQYSDAYNRAFSAYQQQVEEDQFAKQLALSYAQLNRSSGGSRSSSRSSGSGTNEQLQMTSSKNTTSFRALMMTQGEFERHGNKVSGKKYSNYGQYIDTMIGNWRNSGKLNDGEAAWLLNSYGLL